MAGNFGRGRFAFAFQLCRDAIDRVEEGLGAGFDAVGRDAAAAIDPAVVLDLDIHLALGVFADRDGLDAKIAGRRRRRR